MEPNLENYPYLPLWNPKECRELPMSRKLGEASGRPSKGSAMIALPRHWASEGSCWRLRVWVWGLGVGVLGVSGLRLL